MNNSIIIATIIIKNIFVFLSALSVLTSIFICIKFIKNHIDLKACFIAQLLIYNLVLFANWIGLEINHKVTIDCVLMLRFLPIFTMMTITNCRNISMKNLFMDSKIKNFFFLIINFSMIISILVYMNSFQTDYILIFDRTEPTYNNALRYLTHLICSRYANFRAWQIPVFITTFSSMVIYCGVSIYVTFKEKQHLWYRISSIFMAFIPMVYAVLFFSMPSHLDDMQTSFIIDIVYILFVYILGETIRLVDTILACYEPNELLENKKIVIKTVRKALKMDKLDNKTIVKLKLCRRILDNHPQLKQYLPFKKTVGQIATILGLTKEQHCETCEHKDDCIGCKYEQD